MRLSNHLKIALVFIALNQSTLPRAETVIKNAQPCLSGVCIGDDIRNIKHIRWEDISTLLKPGVSLKIPESDAIRLATRIAPRDKVISKKMEPYFHYGVFDSFALEQMRKIKYFCGATLQGAFRSESGYSTMVRFTVRATSEFEQKLEINLIHRSYVGKHNGEETDSLYAQLKERYDAIVYSHSALNFDPFGLSSEQKKATLAYWNFALEDHERTRPPSLTLGKNTDFYPEDDWKKLRLLPGCQSETQKID
jgi:hypothetical protein